jgi:hypothetical protein
VFRKTEVFKKKDAIRRVDKDGAEYFDFPFDQVCKRARELTRQGMEVYQKFSCAGCGQRLGMETPGVFYEEGSCDQCNTVTKIKQRGCNYMVRMSFGIGAPQQGERNDNAADQQGQADDHDRVQASGRRPDRD